MNKGWRSVFTASLLGAAMSLTGCALEQDSSADGTVGSHEQAITGWIGPVSEENNSQFTNYASCSAGDNVDIAISAAHCTGAYCDNMQLHCINIGGIAGDVLLDWSNSHYDTAFFSEEGAASGFCGSNENDFNAVVTGIRASGKYSDLIALECTRLRDSDFFGDKHCIWSGWHSEEGGGMADFPEGYVAVGAKCKGKYCDLINWRICNLR